MLDIPWILPVLLASVLSVWAQPLVVGGRPSRLWPFMYATLVALVAITQAAQPLGLVALMLLAGLAVLQRCGPMPAWLKQSSEVLTIALCFAMAIRLWPGFSETVLLRDIRLSEDAPAFRLTAHLGAGVAGLFMLALYAQRVTSWRELLQSLRSTVPIAVLTTVVVLGIAVAMGYMRFDPKLPGFALLYLVKTLFWTCVVEECFFRGIVQERLMRRGWHASAIVVSAALFGLAHFRGGWPLVALAGLAGLGYGSAYAKSRRVESAMAAHFLLNATHFFLFTYPRIEGPV